MMDDQKKKDMALLALRLAVGGIFIWHGNGKLWGGDPGIPGFAAWIGSMGVPMPLFMAYVVGITEFFGGVAVVLGVALRLATPLLSAVMVVAIVLAKKFAWPAIEIELMLIVSLLVICAHGAGRYGLAARLPAGKWFR